eukprot:364651-Chlamydomonas_euryale.AAC.7
MVLVCGSSASTDWHQLTNGCESILGTIGACGARAVHSARLRKGRVVNVSQLHQAAKTTSTPLV